VVDGLLPVFEEVAGRGWLRPGLNPAAFIYWYAGMVLGRVLVEFGDAGIDLGAWDALAEDALLALIFGERPGEAEVPVAP
jgi:hypothetical protein